jgi:hypothetical protein
MRKDDASFVSIGFEFPELEDKNLKHNFFLVGDLMLKVRKLQNSVKEASGRKEIYIRRVLLKNAKR